MPTGAKRWALVLAPPETKVSSPPKICIGEGPAPFTRESALKLMLSTRFIMCTDSPSPGTLDKWMGNYGIRLFHGRPYGNGPKHTSKFPTQTTYAKVSMITLSI